MLANRLLNMLKVQQMPTQVMCTYCLPVYAALGVKPNVWYDISVGEAGGVFITTHRRLYPRFNYTDWVFNYDDAVAPDNVEQLPPQRKKVQSMKIETITTVNGTNSSDISRDQYIKLMVAEKTRLDQLVATQSGMIDELPDDWLNGDIATCKSNIVALHKLMVHNAPLA